MYRDPGFDINERENDLSDIFKVTITKLSENRIWRFPPHLSIDREYNKHLYTDKEIRQLDDRLCCKVRTIDPDHRSVQKIGTYIQREYEKCRRGKSKNFRPDVVIHTPGTDRHNEVYIEVKKSKRFCGLCWDRYKILCAISKHEYVQYLYKFGIHIILCDTLQETLEKSFIFSIKGKKFIRKSIFAYGS